MTGNLIESNSMKYFLEVIAFAGALCAAFPLFGETETRTFKLTYASAVEVAERLNGQMCRELGPDGKPFRDRVCQRLGGDFDAEGPRGAIGAPAGAMNVVNDYPKGFNETKEQERSQSDER